MDNELHPLLPKYWDELRQKNSSLSEFSRLSPSYKRYLQTDIEFRTWLNQPANQKRKTFQERMAEETAKRDLQPIEKPKFDKGGFIPAVSGASYNVPPISEPTRILGTLYEGRIITTESDPELFERVVKERIKHLAEKRDAPIETSENEAQPFECKWQGQTTKPTKETLWQQIAAFEEVIQVLRREQSKLQNELEAL